MPHGVPAAIGNGPWDTHLHRQFGAGRPARGSPRGPGAHERNASGSLYCLDREECPLYARSDGQIFGWYAQGGPAVDEIERLDDVRFWHKADITNVLIHVRFRR